MFLWLLIHQYAQFKVIYLDFCGWLMFLISDFSDEYSVPA